MNGTAINRDLQQIEDSLIRTQVIRFVVSLVKKSCPNFGQLFVCLVNRVTGAGAINWACDFSKLNIFQQLAPVHHREFRFFDFSRQTRLNRRFPYSYPNHFRISFSPPKD